MMNFACNRSNCFYFANGRCSSITATSAQQTCRQFLAKRQARLRTTPRRIEMAMIRRNLDAAYLKQQAALRAG